jgi:hypothetical protein
VTPPFPELSAYVYPYANTDRGYTHSAPESPMTERERREEMERREIERAKERELDFERAWQRETEDKQNGLQATATSALRSAANNTPNITEKDRTPHRYGTPPPPPRAQTLTPTQTPLALALVQSTTPSLPRSKPRSVSAGRVQTPSQTNSIGSGSGSASGGTNPIPLPPSATPKRTTSSSYLTPKKGPTPALGVMVSPPPSLAGSV